MHSNSDWNPSFHHNPLLGFDRVSIVACRRRSAIRVCTETRCVSPLITTASKFALAMPEPAASEPTCLASDVALRASAIT
jgi:hypothetical protein